MPIDREQAQQRLKALQDILALPEEQVDEEQEALLTLLTSDHLDIPPRLQQGTSQDGPPLTLADATRVCHWWDTTQAEKGIYPPPYVQRARHVVVHKEQSPWFAHDVVASPSRPRSRGKSATSKPP